MAWGPRIPWYIRMDAIVEMRAAGIERLEIDKNISRARLAACFPDQSNWLVSFGDADRGIKWLAKTLGFTGPIELLSMFTCMLLCRDCLVRGPLFFELRSAEVVQARKKFFAESGGMHAHPGYVAVKLGNAMPRRRE